MSPEHSLKKPCSPAGSGIAAVRHMHAEGTGNFYEDARNSALENECQCAILKVRAQKALEIVLLREGVQEEEEDEEEEKQPQLDDGCDLKLKAQKALEKALEVVLLPEDQDPPTPSPTRIRSASAGGQEDRVRVECTVCGYKCVPQWLNDQAHCLKCQAVLKRRPSVHQRGGVAPNATQSGLRPATSPSPPASRVPSPRRTAGPERFFYDKSTFTGTHAEGRRDRGTKRHTIADPTLLSSLSSSPQKTNPTLLTSLSSSQAKSKVKHVAGDDRVRMECNVCGYKCVPQWLNDEAHCLKCQAVLKRRPSVHQKNAGALAVPARSGQRRASTPAKLCDKGSARQMVGPERFFYDKSTYTGAHVYNSHH